MLIDPKARVSRDLGDDGAQPMVVDVPGPTATRAHDMVVVARIARDVGVLPGRKIEAFDRLDVDQEVERPEDRGPAKTEATTTRLDDEVGGREVAVLLGDQPGDSAAWFRSSVAALIQRGQERRGIHHAADRSRLDPLCRD